MTIAQLIQLRQRIAERLANLSRQDEKYIPKRKFLIEVGDGINYSVTELEALRHKIIELNNLLDRSAWMLQNEKKGHQLTKDLAQAYNKKLRQEGFTTEHLAYT